jgi:hypothetical protein
MHRCHVDELVLARTYWVPAVVSPERDWPGAPGCRKGARFIVNCLTLQASRAEFEPFDSRLGCLRWIMRNREHLQRAFPRAQIRAVPLDRWLLGLE